MLCFCSLKKSVGTRGVLNRYDDMVLAHDSHIVDVMNDSRVVMRSIQDSGWQCM